MADSESKSSDKNDTSSLTGSPKKVKEIKQIDNKSRPWCINNKLIEIAELNSGEKMPCVSIFTNKRSLIPEDAWIKVQLNEEQGFVLYDSKTFEFVTNNLVEMQFDEEKKVVLRIMVYVPEEMTLERDRKIFWKEIFEKYMTLAPTPYRETSETGSLTKQLKKISLKPVQEDPNSEEQITDD